MTDFFSKKTDDTTDTQTTQPETVKLGDKEYSQDELSKLVGLGETAQEYETKWNRKISEFYPDYTQKSQKLSEYEKKEQERTQQEEQRKQEELNAKATAGQELSPEETRRIALQQARELGIVTKDDFSTEVNRAVANALAGKQLVDDVTSIISQADEKGQPKTSVDDLLRYMDENGIKNPEKAYKLMFEDDLDKWKEEKLKSIKPAGMTTQTGSTAGAKTPPPAQPISRDNLGQAIREALTRSRGI